MNKQNTYSLVFFGTPQISVFILEELEKSGILPSIVVTAPDKPKGRKMILTPPEVKVWAEKHKIPVLQPKKITEEFVDELKKIGTDIGWDIFIVAAYGKILPNTLINIPKYGVVNVHPSLLPKLRGANPIRGAILEDEKETGVSIMLIDEEMDHGPILYQEKVEINKWPPRAQELEEKLARKGGEILSEVLPKWINGEITPKEQDHNNATFTKKIIKEDGLIDLSSDTYKNLLKIRAYEGWPGAYFFIHKNNKEMRVKIIDAEIENNHLKITRIIPEGKKEMSYDTFIKSAS